MKVLITDFAKQQLADIYEYYKLEGYGNFGRKVRKDVINKALSLREFPNMGSIEAHLTILELGHRYIVVGNYKIIYRVAIDCIYVTDIFDTRRDPDLMMP
jgi:toxin ParE1/3/4